MVEIIGVKFNLGGKVYYFSPKGENIEVNSTVLVETSRGVEAATVAIANREVDESEIVQPLKEIIRVATDEDFEQIKKNKQDEQQALVIATQKANEHKLKMKMVDAEYTFDRSKIILYFTADGRVDFRELVRSLAGALKTRIELRQIGVRDEARQIGGLGICGRPLCCKQFLDDFRPVSIKMAKEQGLSLNPTKISGACSRLMCCLQYEQDGYEYMLKKMPSRGDRLKTPSGDEGVVIDTNTLKGLVKIKIASGDASRIEQYNIDELKEESPNDSNRQ